MKSLLNWGSCLLICLNILKLCVLSISHVICKILGQVKWMIWMNSSFSQIPVCTASSISDGQNPEHLSANAFWPSDWQSRSMSRMMIGQRLSALWVFSQWPADPGEDSKWSGSALVTHSTQATPPWQFATPMHTQKRCMILCQIFLIKIILRATKPPRWHPKL